MFNKYFLYSGGVHVLILIAGIFLFAAPAVKKPLATYTIDFLGNSFQGPSAAPEPEPAQPAPPKEEPEKPAEPAPAPAAPAPDPKAYAAKPEMTAKAKPVPPKKIVLGTPSILADGDKKTKQSSASAAAKPSGADSGGPSGIKTDFSNFPYPWYITQVRNSLWTEWEKRKPKNAVLDTLVSFAILADGSVRNVKTLRSSGNEGYDYAARSSVESAAPFPPLPLDFEKNELTVTVEFKDE